MRIKRFTPTLIKDWSIERSIWIGVRANVRNGSKADTRGSFDDLRPGCSHWMETGQAVGTAKAVRHARARFFRNIAKMINKNAASRIK